MVQICMSADCHLYPYRTVGAAEKAVAIEDEQLEGQISMFGDDEKVGQDESHAEKTYKK